MSIKIELPLRTEQVIYHIILDHSDNRNKYLVAKKEIAQIDIEILKNKVDKITYSCYVGGDVTWWGDCSQPGFMPRNVFTNKRKAERECKRRNIAENRTQSWVDALEEQQAKKKGG